MAGALSYSLRGAFYDPREGNDETFEAARRRPHLLPVATLDLREYLGWEAEVDRCLRAGAAAFRFFPELDWQGWSVSSILFRQALERLAAGRTPLIFSSGGLGDRWGHAEGIARATAGAGLPVILADVNYKYMAEVLAVMRAYPHVYAETNWLATVDGVEIMAEEVGAERLLFGSDQTLLSLGASVGLYLDAGPSAAERRLILHDNAARLFGL